MLGQKEIKQQIFKSHISPIGHQLETIFNFFLISKNRKTLLHFGHSTSYLRKRYISYTFNRAILKIIN